MTELENSKPRENRRSEPALPATLREATFEDYEQIAAVLLRNGLFARPYRHWVNLWENNPAYERYGRRPIGWVLESGRAGIVGTISAFYSEYRFSGREFQAATCGDWAVDPAYRARSMTLLKKFSDCRNPDLLLSTTVTRHAEIALHLLKWHRAPAGRWDTSAFWITNFHGFAEAALALKSVPMARLLSVPASAGLRCYDWLVCRNGAPSRPYPEIDLCEKFDDRFDEFWHRLQRGRDGVLLGVRSRRALEWHFGALLDQRRIWIVTASLNGRMEAYGVFEWGDPKKPGVKRASLVDMQTNAGCERLSRHILQSALQRCRREGVDAVENIGCWLRGPDLQTPFHRKLTNWLYYYKANDRNLSDALADPAVWAPSCFDGDLCL